MKVLISILLGCLVIVLVQLRNIIERIYREVLLQAYIDKMSELLFNKNLKKLLPEDPVLEDALYIARIKTLLILEKLVGDRERKEIVIRFLINTEFISKLHLDLSGANLRNAKLWSVDLRGVNLSGADFRDAKLRDADLSNANLSNVKFSSADLRNVNFSGANLSGTYFSDLSPYIEAKNITPEQIKQAKNWEKAKYSPNFRKKLGL
ncbi:MAG: pentapeptide repeat-containing protein [Cyanobacteriota bacterium]|nr:pentapeptide repeat-containing protein [Cyanobacteriota bacterium]